MTRYIQGDLKGKQFPAKKGGGMWTVVRQENQDTIVKKFLKWIVENENGEEFEMSDSEVRSRIGAGQRVFGKPVLPR